MATKKVWLDVDTGIDDAHAILLALRSPEIEVIGISCVTGNADVDKVVDATLRVLDAAGARPDLPVGRGCDHPFIEKPHPCPQIHGQDSLGDLSPPLPTSCRILSHKHGVALLLSALRSTPTPIIIIALAPLTNIASAIRSAPALFAEKVERIVWMGGGTFLIISSSNIFHLLRRTLYFPSF